MILTSIRLYFFSRTLLKLFDEELGEPIPEKDYGGNCAVYDLEVPDDPFHNVKDKMDIFMTFVLVCMTGIQLHLISWSMYHSTLAHH